ncbi:hypothetical protein [Actinacidiphila alni]|uniref:hypothetical protein n=1 Tax=Actinacidiphila alni TaxID=380248 RepID=UPI001160BDEE|nr:hypothetical protein [Actinacidiphila alni]
MRTLIRSARPSSSRGRRPVVAAFAVVVLALAGGALAGCGAGSTAQDPPKLPFGWSPSGPSDTPPTWGGTTGADTARPSGTSSTGGTSGTSRTEGSTFSLDDLPTRAAGATPVGSPSFSSEAHKCPTRESPNRWCVSGHEVYPAIDPAAPCVDFDLGDHRGTTYFCLNGSWTKLDGLPGGGKTAAGR